MRVYVCDRCRRPITSGGKDFFVRKPSKVYRFGKKMHLCGECAESFRRWLTEKKGAGSE